MSGKTCSSTSVADADGNCSCAYPASNSKLAGFTDATGTPALANEQAQAAYDKAKEMDDQNQLDDCVAVKARCDAACEPYGGATKNTCTSEGTALTSTCTCSNNGLDYDLDNEANQEDTDTSTDSDGDGVPDSIDPDSTGGPDSNADNTDDIAAAIKGAIASLGISEKIDKVNSSLNSLSNYVGQKISEGTAAVASVGSKVDSLGGKIDGVGSAVSGLGSKIDGVGSSVDGLGTSLGGKLDGLGEKLDGISDKLDDGLEATGSSDLPGTNEYNTDLEELEEQSFVDTVHNFLNSSLPVLSSISGSGLTASGSPSISTELWGETIRIDFSDWQGVLRAAGLVLVAVATIFAFIIIL